MLSGSSCNVISGGQISHPEATILGVIHVRRDVHLAAWVAQVLGRLAALPADRWVEVGHSRNRWRALNLLEQKVSCLTREMVKRWASLRPVACVPEASNGMVRMAAELALTRITCASACLLTMAICASVFMLASTISGIGLLVLNLLMRVCVRNLRSRTKRENSIVKSGIGKLNLRPGRAC